ncbi:prepilin-type N-terminal cleavage/methylation domain-containing protein [Candidatus Saccharibacteria bacterium]|nr:prepilin-type N-terminal cleavage/methylation domain-containing protein [Candidatus Saccharibacteria bacterium]
MSKRDGFTIVEVVIVMIIMAILLTLSTVSLVSSQVNARDTQRKADVENIARGLETRYRVGNPVVTAPLLSAGSYPATEEMRHIMGASSTSLTPNLVTDGYISKALPGATNDSFTSPKASSSRNLVLISAGCITSGTAENMTTINACVNADPEPYYYESVAADGSICNGTTTCVRYNLYYKLEKDGTIITVRSDRQ